VNLLTAQVALFGFHLEIADTLNRMMSHKPKFPNPGEEMGQVRHFGVDRMVTVLAPCAGQ